MSKKIFKTYHEGKRHLTFPTSGREVECSVQKGEKSCLSGGRGGRNLQKTLTRQSLEYIERCKS